MEIGASAPQSSLEVPGKAKKESYNQAQQFRSWVRVHPEKTTIQNDTCTPVFTAALFTIARTWKQPKCPLTDECMMSM